MTITKTYCIEVTGEELQLIRSALCNKSIKELGRAHEAQRECKEKGLRDTTSQMYMDARNKIRNIINKIDEVE